MSEQKKVKMELVGLDGNAFSVMGAFKREARRQGWTAEEVKVVLDKCMSGDYNQLLCTIMENTESPDESSEDDADDEDDDRCPNCRATMNGDECSHCGYER